MTNIISMECQCLRIFQAIGIKSNYSQPFFVHWDVILGTCLTREEIDRQRESRKERLE